MKIIKAFLYTFILTISTLLFSGFPAGTQVKIPGGYKSIEQLKVGDLVYAIKPDGNCTITPIEQTVSYVWHKYMLIEIDDITIATVTGQRFYQPENNVWIKAKHIEQATPLLSGQSKIRYVHSAHKIHEPIQLFDIRLKDTHTFCVSEHDIVVHNFLQFTIGFSIAWGCGVVTFEAFWQACIIGLVALGLRSCSSNNNNHNWKHQAYVHTPINNTACEIGHTVSQQEHVPVQCHTQQPPVTIVHSTCPETPIQNNPITTCNHATVNITAMSSDLTSNETLLANTKTTKRPTPQHNYPISQHSPGKNCGTISCDPPPKGPYGYFIPSDKHNAQSQGQISPGPTWEDGQKALDKSAEVKNDDPKKETKRRIVVYGGKYIVFDQTSPGVYHGHYRDWDDTDTRQGLTQPMKNALQEAGIVTGLKGKILNDAQKKQFKET